MTRADALKAYQELSARVSENVRQLAFAALAVVWVFRPTTATAAWVFPAALVRVGAFAVGAIVFDFLQYLYGTAAWGLFHRSKEKAGVPLDGLILAPRQLNWPSNAFFALKTAALAATYVELLRYFFARLYAPSIAA